MLEVKNAFDEFGRYVTQQAKSNLTREGHRDSSDLYDSLGYKTIVYPSGALAFIYTMESYGSFVDKGVKGFRSSKKAPSSPYRFGTGSGETGGLTKGIDKWVRSRRIQFRDSEGRFLTYDSTAFLIRRSIWDTGLKTTNFFTKPFETAYKRLPDIVLEKYGIGFDRLMNIALKNKTS